MDRDLGDCQISLDLLVRGMSDETSPSLIPVSNGRLMSLDAFRGFIMFWIVGGEALAHALAKLDGVQSEVLNTVMIQLKHVSWEGFRFYDLIFPSFVFIVGASVAFSLGKLQASGSRRAAVRRVIWRGLLLWLIGIILWRNLRWIRRREVARCPAADRDLLFGDGVTVYLFASARVGRGISGFAWGVLGAFVFCGGAWSRSGEFRRGAEYNELV